MLVKLLLVGAAGGAGSVARYLVSVGAARLGAAIPWGTLLVNAAGCAAIGALMYAFEQKQAVSETTRVALAVGFLGGFTTFSAFGYETFALARDGHRSAAAVNVVASVALGLGGVWLGWAGARAVWG